MNRMVIAVLALLGLLVAAYMSAYKLGLIGTLACGVGSCEIVQASRWAVFWGIPVALIGMLGYAVIMGIALLGLQPRWFNSKRLANALFILATAGFVYSMYLTYLEKFVIHAWCLYCIASGVIATLIWIFALAELPRLRRAT
jgi:uncharacterized membrane protein